MRLIDIATAAMSPAIALALREPAWSSETTEILFQYTLVSVVFSLVFLSHFGIGQILPRLMSRRDVFQIVKAAAATTAFTALATFSITRLQFIPRSLPVIHGLVFICLLSGWRAAVGAFERKSEASAVANQNPPRVSMLIVGVNPTTSLYIRLLKSMPDVRPNIVGLLDDNERLHGRSVDGHVILGRIERCEAIMAELESHGVEVRRILIAHVDRAAQKEAAGKLEKICAARGVTLDILAARLGVEDAQDAPADDVAQQSVFESSHNRVREYLERRRYVDVSAAALALVALAPALLVVALLIRLRLGAPVTFWQQRVGRAGGPIIVHKFRTFAPAVDSQGRPIAEEERLTRLGRVLRALRIDELPQLLDVLRGEMNIVGPRPLLPADLAEDSWIRESVMPGLTGWAQVHGGKAVTAEEKLALDEWYVHHACPSLDLRIVWLTLRMMVIGDARADGAIAEAMSFRERRLSMEAQLRERSARCLGSPGDDAASHRSYAAALVSAARDLPPPGHGPVSPPDYPLKPSDVAPVIRLV